MGWILLVILIPLLIIILLIAVLNSSNESKRLLESLADQLKQLRRDVTELEKNKEEEAIEEHAPQTWKRKTWEVPPVTETQKPAPPYKEEKPVPIEETIPITPSAPVEVKKPEPSIAAFTPIEEEKPATDLEKFIGENLINKIGIAVLVLGIAFFIKYAIDRNWIGEGNRVIIGLVCGCILIGLAHYFRNKYRSFSSVLVGGGLSVLYFSVAFAFHQYHLIGQGAAFFFMVVVSALGVVLSIFYNRQELAILAAIGGFITPFLVSTGQENHIALFSYLGILNGGLMVLAAFKRWPAINTLALLFTTFIYAGWMIKRSFFEDPGPLPYRDALLFASLFYILFVVMGIINSLRLKRKFTALEFILLLSTNFLFYLAGMVILGDWQYEKYQGLFTAALGVFNGILALTFYKRKNTDPHFITLLIGLSLGFISLFGAVELDANFMVLFWALESVLLYLLFRRSGIRLLRIASIIVLCCMIIGLLINWTDIYLFEAIDNLPVLINRGFITAFCCSVALYILYVLAQKNEEDSQMSRAILITLIITAYLTGAFEIIYQFQHSFPTVPVHIIFLQLYTFAAALLIGFVYRNNSSLPAIKVFLTIVCLGFYLITLNAVYNVSRELFVSDQSILFLAHWISAIVLFRMLYELVKIYSREAPAELSAFTWIIAPVFVILFSAEMYHLLIWTNYNQEDWVMWQNLYYKAGLSILWGLSSFAMMWIGMKKDFRTLRIISLTLFTITLIKLFTYDIRNIAPGGKIAAFIMLGILLLAVSFMYQRLKKLIIENTSA